MTKDQKQRTTACRPVVEKARAQVEELVADLLADPGGEAAQVAKTLLLNSMVKEQTRQEEEALRELQGQGEARVMLEEDVGTLAVDSLNAHTRSSRLADELRVARICHHKIGHYVDWARKALAEKKPFDYERALKQISAVIGLSEREEFLHDEQATEATDC